MDNTSDAKKITLETEDGQVREIKKGFLCTMTPAEDGKGTTFSFDLVGFSGSDLKDMIFGVVSLGDRLGLFGSPTEGAADE